MDTDNKPTFHARSIQELVGDALDSHKRLSLTLEPDNSTAAEAKEYEKTANDWPPHSAANVSRVIGALEVLGETLPCITDSDRSPHATRMIVYEACAMLNSYRLSCFVTEKDNDRRAREAREDELAASWRRINEARFEERVKVAAEERAKELLRDLAKIQKNAKRRKTRKDAMKGAKRV